MKIVKTIFFVAVLLSGLFAVGHIGEEERLSRMDVPAIVEETDHSVNRFRRHGQEGRRKEIPSIMQFP